jgi:hypothetical protein
MSDSQTLFPVAVQDPPLLRSLLLVAGNDLEVRAEITRAYYAHQEGAKASPWVMSAVLLSAIGNAVLRATPASNGNGVGDGQLKSSQLEALALSLKALPGRDEVASKQDLQALQQQVSQVAQAVQKIEQASGKEIPDLRLVVEDLKFATGAMNKKLGEAGLKPPEPWKQWLKASGIAALVAIIFFLAGRYADARQEAIAARQANAQLIDALKRLPSAANVTTFVRSKGGDLTIDKIKLADGRDGAGIIIRPGTLKLGPLSMSQEGGNALVPIDLQ